MEFTHRKVKGGFRGGFTVNGRPLVFYHFSGLDSGAQQAMLDKYGSEMPALYELRKWYLAECDRMGQAEMGALPWSFATFDNGNPVTMFHGSVIANASTCKRPFPIPTRRTTFRDRITTGTNTIGTPASGGPLR